MELFFSELVVFNLVLSVIMAVVAWTLHRWSWLAALLVCGLFTFAFGPFPYIAVCGVIQTTCVFVLPETIRGRTRVLISSIVIVVSFALFAIPGIWRVHWLYHFRVRYPVTSLEDRLAFETEAASRSRKHVSAQAIAAGPNVAHLDAASQSATISSSVEQRLAESESNSLNEFGRRSNLFKALHERQREKVEAIRGFGLGSVSSIAYELMQLENDQWREELDRLKSEKDNEPESFIEFNGTTIRRADDGDPASVSIPANDRLLGLHAAGVGDFLRPDGFGYVPANRQAVGFRSHAFHQPKPSVTTDDPDLRWSIRRLELVSLLRFETPRVYVTEQLPNLEHLKSVPTRPLSEFEQSNLPKLYRDEDVVVQESAGSILMLGSLRANKVCLKCHSVERGELLGAFSYELRLAKAIHDSSKPARR